MLFATSFFISDRRKSRSTASTQKEKRVNYGCFIYNKIVKNRLENTEFPRRLLAFCQNEHLRIAVLSAIHFDKISLPFSWSASLSIGLSHFF